MPISDTLISNEQIVVQTKKHWIAPLRDSVWAIILIVVGLFLGVISPNGDGIVGSIGDLLDLARIVLVIVGVVWIAYNIVIWRTAEFAITNLRVMRDEGLLSKRQSATLLTGITDVNSDVGFLGRSLGYGDLKILTQSGESGADVFNTILDPIGFRNIIMERKLAAMSGHATAPPIAAPPAVVEPAPAAQTPAVTPPASPPGPTSAESADALARLADLHDRGAITDAEFETKKAEILARM